MANFAKRELLKFGWEEGKGLGKDKDGITKPIKAVSKSTFEGFKYKKETCTEWWEKEYNNAIQNIQVESNEDGVILSTIEDNRDFSKKKQNTMKYIGFQKTCILHNGHLIQDNSTTLEKKQETAQDSASSTIPSPHFQPYAAHNKMLQNITSLSCTASVKLESITLKDNLLISSPLTQPHNNAFSSFTAQHLLPREDYSLAFYEKKAKHANKIDQVLNKKEEKDKYEANNNIMLQALRTLTGQSKSKNKKFKKRMNNLTQRLNNCSINEKKIEKKDIGKRFENDHLKDKFLRNVRSNTKECFKNKKLEYIQLIRKKDLEPCMAKKEDTSKQARSQGEKECVVQITQFEHGTNDDTFSSKEENFKSPDESFVKESTCVITLAKSEVSKHGNTDRNIKNLIYFHKCKKKHKNKHKNNKRSKIEDVIKNITNKRDIDFVAKALTDISLTENVSKTIKKKPTQTHITPV